VDGWTDTKIEAGEIRHKGEEAEARKRRQQQEAEYLLRRKLERMTI